MPRPFPKKSSSPLSSKVAQTQIAYIAYNVDCPHCFAEQNEPSSGSRYWMSNEDHGQHSQICWECKKTYKLPKALKGK